MLQISQEVLIGIVSALVVSFLAFSSAWIKNYYVRRKYPVAGTYVTHYEDEAEGKQFVVTAISRFKQSGRRLSGQTVLKNGRTWLLDGSIMGIGHIAGVYSAEATDDEGVGSYYLRINGMTLDGLWSGYDNVNKRILSGRYFFKRLLKTRIRALKSAEAPAALAIAEKVFGPNYLSGADLTGASGLRVFAAVLGGKLVAFAAIEKAAGVSKKVSEETKLPMDVQLAEKSKSLGIIRTIAVAEEFQGHGIGQQLFLAMERVLIRERKTLIAVPAWEDNTGVHLGGILSLNEYEPFLTCKQYWKNDCDNGTFVCRCRSAQGECICNLIWYKKAIG